MGKMVYRAPDGNNDVTKLIRLARDSGWIIERSRKHLKWTSPSGYVTFTSATPRRPDTRALKRHLRRGGLDV